MYPYIKFLSYSIGRLQLGHLSVLLTPKKAPQSGQRQYRCRIPTATAISTRPATNSRMNWVISARQTSSAATMDMRSMILRALYARSISNAPYLMFSSFSTSFRLMVRRRLMPCSCMVTPYKTSASSMVPRRWVMTMN